MSSSEVFQRVGRGGAGNYYSKKDIREVDKVEAEDLEAQKHRKTAPAVAQPLTGSSSSPSGYSRAGRGGAGNFYDPKDTDEARQQEREDSRRTHAALTTGGAKPRTGLSGRGGVGNWSDSSAAAQAEQRDEEEERKRKEDLEAQVLQHVDAGLAPPPAAYHSQGREPDER